jgi:hypothetical protein
MIDDANLRIVYRVMRWFLFKNAECGVFSEWGMIDDAILRVVY